MTKSFICLLLAAGLAASPVANAVDDAQSAFFSGITRLCDATFEGGTVFPKDPSDDFADKTLVAHMASCTADEIRIPFAVGENRSRTWIIRKTPAGLSLKHDHRHADGTPDNITMYGGLATASGGSTAQTFDADTHTAQRIPAAATNAWTPSLENDGRTMTYFLARDVKPRFKAELHRK